MCVICWWNSPDLLLLYIKNHSSISTSFPRFLVSRCISVAPIYKVCSRFICTIALATIWVVCYLCWAQSIILLLLLAFSAFYRPIFRRLIPNDARFLQCFDTVDWAVGFGIWPVNVLLQYLQTLWSWLALLVGRSDWVTQEAGHVGRMVSEWGREEYWVTLYLNYVYCLAWSRCFSRCLNSEMHGDRPPATLHTSRRRPRPN